MPKKPPTGKKPTTRRPSPHMIAQTAAKKKEMLEAFSLLGTVSKACQRVGMDRRSHYVWMKDDPEYAADFVSANDRFIESLEHEVFRRGVVGIDKPIIHQGKLMTRTDDNGKEVPLTVKEFSDSLLMFRLKKERPEYRERFEHSGPDGGPIPVNVEAGISKAVEDLKSTLDGLAARLSASAASS